MSPATDGMLSFTSKYEGEEEIEAFIPATIKGEEKIAFSRNYMLEAAKMFSEITLEVTTPSSPIKIYGDLDGVTLVVMPMFVQW